MRIEAVNSYLSTIPQITRVPHVGRHGTEVLPIAHERPRILIVDSIARAEPRDFVRPTSSRLNEREQHSLLDLIKRQKSRTDYLYELPGLLKV